MKLDPCILVRALAQTHDDVQHQKVEADKFDSTPIPGNSSASNQMTMSFTQKTANFFKKYFCEGQKLSKSHESELEGLPADAAWHQKVLIKYRRLIGVLIPFIIYNLVWWSLAIKHNYFAYFPDRYYLSITMIFGAMIGGATSEGGGAVAFPVMTLALGIPPAIARDFSMMCQSCGMCCAAFTIVWMKIKLEWHSIVFCSFGAVFGLILGLEVIDDLITNNVKKLGFVSIWFSFAFALFLLNREKKRKTYDSIVNFCAWHAVVLVLTGFIGGIFTAIAGSGVDICSFSILSLLFRISEKVSTPTSVILMAINTVTGFYWRQFMTDTGAEPEAWKYLAVVVPVVVFFGPFGSFVSSYFHRQVLAMFIYVLDTLALVTALCVIPMDLEYSLLVAGLILGGFVFFFIIGKVGERIMRRHELQQVRPAIADPVDLRGHLNCALDITESF